MENVLAKASRLPEFDRHQAAWRFEDGVVGLRGFIAIHNDQLGPATGGTRMYPYQSEEAALRDVLKLSRAMTYKCALAGVPYGGGKAVIIADPRRDKTEERLRVYAKIVNRLKGVFTTGEDVGIAEADVQIMFQESPFFNGRSGVAGDPSPYAALSVLTVMRRAAREVFGDENLASRGIAIKGLGKVGSELLRLLLKAGAKVIASDINQNTVKAIKDKYPSVELIAAEQIHSATTVDIFAPCALGSDITQTNVGEISAKLICGGANNQLADRGLAEALHRRGIIFIPDYVANAGGLINVIDEREPGGYNRRRVLERINHLTETAGQIFNRAHQTNQSLLAVAEELAEERFSR